MKFPARRILVPDDLTPASRHPWAWARRLASPDARLESLFVYDMPPVAMVGLPAPLLTPGMEKNLLERMAESRPESTARRVEAGETASVILRRSRRTDLIVVGTHGRKGFARAAFGSVAESVARDASVPVLAVRSAPREVRTVLAPVNLQGYALEGLRLAAEAAAFFEAELVLLHLSPPGAREGNPRFFLNGLLDRLPGELREAARPRLVLRGGDPIPGILDESDRHGLVVLTAHRKSLVGDFVMGTTVERVLRHSSVPVLAAPSGD